MKKELVMSNLAQPETDTLSFTTLHKVYHERDFRVRVNDTTVALVRNVLAEVVEFDSELPWSCPACRAGYEVT